jgi:hypothetical protein
MFSYQSDNRGGANGFYNPSYFCPKGTIIFLLVPVEIRVKKEWKGYISFQHSIGSDNRTYVRKKITIKNKLPYLDKVVISLLPVSLSMVDNQSV